MTLVDDLLEESKQALSGLQLFDTNVPTNPPARYAVFYCDPGLRSVSSFGKDRREHRFNFQFNFFAPKPESARFLATKVADHLTTTRLSVEGMRVQLPRQTFVGQVGHDGDVPAVPVAQITAQFSIEAFQTA